MPSSTRRPFFVHVRIDTMMEVTAKNPDDAHKIATRRIPTEYGGSPGRNVSITKVTEG